MTPNTVEEISSKIINCFKGGGKLLVLGCGGLAAESSHLAAELVCKYKHERRALPAISLTVDPAIITAIGNDYGFTRVFSRQIEALGRPGDLVVAMSTSGKSPSVLEAIETAKNLGITTIDWPRKGKDTAETQEIMLSEIHQISQRVEEAFL